MATFPASWLRDDFADNSEAPAWGASYVVGSATKQETGGRAVLTLPALTAGTHEAAYRSSATYDLTGDGWFIDINQMVSTAVAAAAYFMVRSSSGNYVRWHQQSGTLRAQHAIGGVLTDLFSVAWNATTYRYLRIRESGGTVFFDSSSNGTSWTNRASVTLATLGWGITAVDVTLAAVVIGSVASPGAFRVEAFNPILPALATNWNYVQAEWLFVDRFRTITLAASSGQACLAVAESKDASGNLVNPRYFAGPLGSSSGGYAQLVEYASLAEAQAAAVNLPLDGRWDLPQRISGRIFRLYVRSTTGSPFDLREFIPRRLVQTDDLEAENIDAKVIRAGTISVDKLVVTLTLTGRTIQTNESGARAVMSGDPFGGFIGYGASDTYNPLTGSGTYQVLWSKNDGKVYGAGGKVVIDASGLTIRTGNTYGDDAALKFYDPTGTTKHATLGQWATAATNRVELHAEPNTGLDQEVWLSAYRPSGKYALINLFVWDAASKSGNIVLSINAANVTAISLLADTTTIDGGLNVGTATGAAAGEIRAANTTGLHLRMERSGQTTRHIGITGSNTLAIARTGVAEDISIDNSGNVNLVSGVLRIAGTQVLSTRKTGWGTPTGTLNRAALSNASTQTQINQAVMALITDLISHGTIGA